MTTWLSHLLQAPSPPVTSLADLFARIDDDAFAPGVERAAYGGRLVDRLGFAFAAGYTQALRVLVPALPSGARASLCATEEGGVHPRAIATTLSSEGRLGGRKTFATLATEADTLLVVATTGTDGHGRNRLRLVRVDARASGISIRALAPTSFAPEIHHAEVTFTDVDVSADAVLPGDGFDAYLKPFRTIEDVHVLAAALGYVLGVGLRHAWPEDTLEDTVTLLVGAHALARLPPGDVATHLALAGLFRQVRAHLAAAEPHWLRVDEETRARWQRDTRLLTVAETARTQRRQRAWTTLRGDHND